MRIVQFNNKDNFAAAYGNDHAVGVFLTVWKLKNQFPNESFENMVVDPQAVVYDKDELFDKLSEEQLIKDALIYGFEIKPNELKHEKYSGTS